MHTLVYRHKLFNFAHMHLLMFAQFCTYLFIYHLSISIGLCIIYTEFQIDRYSVIHISGVAVEESQVLLK